jgi:hypothetical protein
MRMIDVPEVEKEAYNPDRPISGLIQMQLIHLSTAEQTLPPRQRTGINIATLHSEGQAADYIQKVTAMLHKSGTAQKKTAKKKSGGKSSKTVGSVKGSKSAKASTPVKATKLGKAAKKPAAKSGKGRKAAKTRK